VLIRLLAITTAPLLPLNLGFGLGTIVDEFGRTLFEEIDYRREADNAERFAGLFADHPEVTVPRVERRTSRPVGCSPPPGSTAPSCSSVRSSRRAGLDPGSPDPHRSDLGSAAAARIRLLPCRPPPGNLFALPGKTGPMGHLAYVDFGMMDSISDRRPAHSHRRGGASDQPRLRGPRPRASWPWDFSIPRPIWCRSCRRSKQVLGGALGDNVGSFNFKAITDRFSAS
jgi:hypothetical protein